jgi:hypothetical protein
VDDDERTPGGSRVFRHQAQPRKWQAPATTDGGAAVSAYLSPYLGEARTVLHEVLSDRIHLDVHIVPPTPERPSYVLYTSGMSDLPMETPVEARGMEYAELLISLPAEWPMPPNHVVVGGNHEPEPPGYWPIGYLKFLARIPHDYRTWLGPGHTIPNGDPPRNLAPDTGLCCWWLLAARQLPVESQIGTLPDGRRVHFLSVHALYESEMSFKLNEGSAALEDCYVRAGVSEVLDLKRPPFAPNRPLGRPQS